MFCASFPQIFPIYCKLEILYFNLLNLLKITCRKKEKEKNGEITNKCVHYAPRFQLNRLEIFTQFIIRGAVVRTKIRIPNILNS